MKKSKTFIILSSFFFLSSSLVFGQKKTNQKEMIPDWFSVFYIPEIEQFKSDSTKWFISPDGKSKLFFILNSDFSVRTEILTTDKVKNPELIKILKSEGINYSNPNMAIKIDELISEMGAEIGMSINYAKTIFGKPDSEKSDTKRTFLTWNFLMLENGGPLPDNLPPLISKGLEYRIYMEFYEDELIALIYQYQVP
ncbi:hypothetical protein [uncultured Dokdonia sp.]|uniref:hypothetical protein n=1 Tax=uncultured Dokdonia sp. TaxID=575653 RepID=UPI00262CFB5A|nr:hypothetical protein [uncultured Dokdonia sp.]